MRRFLLDANIVISGLLFTGCEAELLRSSREHHGVLIISDDVREEVERVINRKFGDLKSMALSILDELNLPKIAREVYEFSNVHHTSVRDPDDRHLLACAVETGCEVLVTGDGDLHALGLMYQGVRIVNARTALALLTGED